MLEAAQDTVGSESQNNANLNISIVRAYSTLDTPIRQPPRPNTRLVVCTEFLP